MTEQVPAVWQKFAVVCGLEGSEGRARDILKESVLRGGSDTDLWAFAAIAAQYGLNPLLKEIHAFKQGGALQPIVGVDGWIKIGRSHDNFGRIAHEYRYAKDGDAEPRSCWAGVYDKDGNLIGEAEEFLAECRRNTPAWKQPHRMLGHRARIQALRNTYGIGGIMTPDEAEGMREAEFREEKKATTRDAILSGAREVVAAAPDRLEVSEPPAEEPAGDWPTDGEMQAAANGALWADAAKGDPEA